MPKSRRVQEVVRVDGDHGTVVNLCRQGGGEGRLPATVHTVDRYKSTVRSEHIENGSRQ